MKVLAAVLLGLLLVGAPVRVVFISSSAPPLAFPYHTMSDVVADVTDVTPGSCQGEFGAVLIAEVPTRFMVFYIGEGRFVVGEWADAATFNQSPPPIIWIGTATSDGVLRIDRREPYDLVIHGDGPCRLLYPERYL